MQMIRHMHIDAKEATWVRTEHGAVIKLRGVDGDGIKIYTSTPTVHETDGEIYAGKDQAEKARGERSDAASWEVLPVVGYDHVYQIARRCEP